MTLPMTPAQARALADLVGGNTMRLTLTFGLFDKDLPAGYIYCVRVDKRTAVVDFHCSIAPDGSVSS